MIKPRPASRQAGEPPKPIAIERTSSYLIRKKGQYETREWNPVSEDGDSVTVSRQASIPGDDNETPVSWMLRKTDESLDIVEDKVPDVARRAITFMTGNIGTNTSKVAVDAAKLAVKGGSKLVEAALPAGKWAISKGFGAVVSVAMTQQGRRKEKPRQKDDSV